MELKPFSRFIMKDTDSEVDREYTVATTVQGDNVVVAWLEEDNTINAVTYEWEAANSLLEQGIWEVQKGL
ncbi:hypothetical protein ACQUY5_27060 [Bacillus cereus]|uniref:hypothetical protein n=1 Tax=Bacillus cereus TaxID=1396 RepID=UPI003D16A6A6